MSNSELEQLGAAFIDRFIASSVDERISLKAAGADLADRLRHQAIELSYSKATEFSPQIRLYHQLAAKIALLVYWPDREALATFDQDIRYYANFAATQALVDEYESFRQEYIDSLLQPPHR